MRACEREDKVEYRRVGCSWVESGMAGGVGGLSVLGGEILDLAAASKVQHQMGMGTGYGVSVLVRQAAYWRGSGGGIGR